MLTPSRPFRLAAAFALALIVLVFPVSAAFAAQTPVTFTLTNLNVPAGDNFMPANGTTIPTGYTQLTVRMDLTSWQPTDNIYVLANYSTDGGTTWSDQGGVMTNGGQHFNTDGITPLQPGFIAGVPAGSGVKVRAHFIVPSAHQISGSLTLN